MLDMVQTQGTQNKRVSVLFTPDMIASIDSLVKYREVGIKADNRYLFATAAEGRLDSLHPAALATFCRTAESHLVH